MPRSQDEILGTIRQALNLDKVLSIDITPDALTIARMIHPDEKVLPDSFDDFLDPEFLVSHIELGELEFEPERHPYLMLTDAMDKLSQRSLSPVAMIGPKETVCAYFGLEEFGLDPEGVERFFGMRVLYHTQNVYPEKVVIVGAPNGILSQACLGVIIDMGVEQ